MHLDLKFISTALGQPMGASRLRLWGLLVGAESGLAWTRRGVQDIVAVLEFVTQVLLWPGYRVRMWLTLLQEEQMGKPVFTASSVLFCPEVCTDLKSVFACSLGDCFVFQGLSRYTQSAVPPPHTHTHTPDCLWNTELSVIVTAPAGLAQRFMSIEAAVIIANVHWLLGGRHL